MLTFYKSAQAHLCLLLNYLQTRFKIFLCCLKNNLPICSFIYMKITCWKQNVFQKYPYNFFRELTDKKPCNYTMWKLLIFFSHQNLRVHAKVLDIWDWNFCLEFESSPRVWTEDPARTSDSFRITPVQTHSRPKDP